MTWMINNRTADKRKVRVQQFPPPPPPPPPPRPPPLPATATEELTARLQASGRRRPLPIFRKAKQSSGSTRPSHSLGQLRPQSCRWQLQRAENTTELQHAQQAHRVVGVVLLLCIFFCLRFAWPRLLFEAAVGGERATGGDAGKNKKEKEKGSIGIGYYGTTRI